MTEWSYPECTTACQSMSCLFTVQPVLTRFVSRCNGLEHVQENLPRLPSSRHRSSVAVRNQVHPFEAAKGRELVWKLGDCELI